MSGVPRTLSKRDPNRNAVPGRDMLAAPRGRTRISSMVTRVDVISGPRRAVSEANMLPLNSAARMRTATPDVMPSHMASIAITNGTTAIMCVDVTDVTVGFPVGFWAGGRATRRCRE